MARKKLKIRVSLPRNVRDQAFHWIMEDATEFFAKKLMGTRLANLLNIRVHVRKTTMCDKTRGQVTLHATGSRRQRDYKIELNYAKGLHQCIETLGHEMVHVRQKAKDQLQYRYNYTTGKIMARWINNPVMPVEEIPYIDRPWEIEARKLQKGLYKDYIEYVRVKHAKANKEEQCKSN